METFQSYATYYDALNKGKDYKAEFNYVDNIIISINKEFKNVLEIGCGTGKHTIHFVNNGYSVVGIDISKPMIEHAKLYLKESENLEFIHSGASELRLDRKFDIVLSLFHVVSYQTNYEQLSELFNCAARHLKKGGLFIFDFWHGPGVISDRPQIRIKIGEDDENQIYRLTTPYLYPDKNLVEVNFQFLVENKVSHTIQKFNEQHLMRYYFLPELRHFLKSQGFKVINEYQWMSQKSPSIDTWYACMVNTFQT